MTKARDEPTQQCVAAGRKKQKRKTSEDSEDRGLELPSCVDLNREKDTHPANIMSLTRRERGTRTQSCESEVEKVTARFLQLNFSPRFPQTPPFGQRIRRVSLNSQEKYEISWFSQVVKCKKRVV